MKTGRTLQALAQEIERQSSLKKDYIAPTRAITFAAQDDQLQVALDVGGELRNYAVNQLAARQIGEHAGIPAQYFDRSAKSSPAMLAAQLNHWFNAAPQSERRTVRTLDGKVRALLSDGYRPLDNVDLAEAALPALRELNVEVLSCEITERRLYIKAVDSRITRDVPTGRKMGDGSHVVFDTLAPVISISNSEVGSGSLSVEAGVYTKACTNLAFFAERSMKRFHIGKRHDLTEGLVELLTEKTRRLTDRAIWAQVGDVIRGAFNEMMFDTQCNRIAAMGGHAITGDLVKVVEVAAKRFGANEGERSSVLRHLSEGGDLTQYGLFNAFTRTAEDVADYDRASEFERIGGQIIDLAANDWKEIAEAA